MELAQPVGIHPRRPALMGSLSAVLSHFSRLLGSVAGRVQGLVRRLTPKWLSEWFELDPLQRLTPVEKITAVFLGASPVLMALVDNGADCASVSHVDPAMTECGTGYFRGSISAYFNMIHYEWFFVPLMIGALLLTMNGVLRKGHWWNVLIGMSLLGVLLFDKEGRSSKWHFACAVVFFVGNVAVFLSAHWRTTAHDLTRQSSGPAWKTNEMIFRSVLVLVVVVAMLLYFFNTISLLWAEWLSLIAICVHFYRDESKHEADHHVA